MFGYKDMSEIVSEFCNCAAGISGAYETPAKASKDSTTLTGEKIKDTKAPILDVKKGLAKQWDRDKKPIDWGKMVKKMNARRGDNA